MKTIRVALTALALLIILGGSASCAQVWEETRITGDEALPQGHPQIWGDTVWWVDVRTSGSGYYQIRNWSPHSGEGVVTQVPRYTALDAAYQETLVYERYTPDWTTDLFTWDPVNGERAISTAPGRQSSPDIYGSTVVYEDHGGSVSQIRVWDPVNGDRALSPSSYKQCNPRISAGGTVVWEDYRHGRADIYLYTPGTGESRLSTYIYPMMKPAIYEGRVLMWVPYDPDFDFGEAGMWEWTPSGGLRMLWAINMPLPPHCFDVWDDTIVFSDGAQSNVFAYDPPWYTRINQSAQGYAGGVSLYGNRAVWVGSHDIYLSTLVVPEPSSLLALAGGGAGLLVLLGRRRRAQ